MKPPVKLMRKLTPVLAMLTLFAGSAFAGDVSQAVKMNKHALQSAQPGNPAVVYVNETSMAAFPDGESWRSAYASLAEALQSDMVGKFDDC